MVRRLVGALAAVAVGVLVGAVPASAAAGYTLFGDATRVHPGHNSHTAIQLRSISTGIGYGGIDFKVPSGMTFSQIQNLGTDYNFTAASCGLGSPRFQINMLGKNAFVYIGPPPNYTGCPPNVWVTTGNLAIAASFIDTSQLPGGTFYDTFASAQTKYGSVTVTGIQLVSDFTQTVLVDNVQINTTTYTFERRGHGQDGGDNGDNGDNNDNNNSDNGDSGD
ncbi:MAG TPA: hypothetical protein VN906_09100 [Candidatus Sulfotelmatobacter sp.]|nr:hypothetical protein [Candidatus Sulfotelmatobacter sp.]